MKSEELLQIIERIDTFIAQLRIEGMTDLAERVAGTLEELYWVYHELTTFD